ncbi:hypothetical protein V8C42DRAFT_361738 [Trichoderma barbatum]
MYITITLYTSWQLQQHNLTAIRWPLVNMSKRQASIAMPATFGISPGGEDLGRAPKRMRARGPLGARRDTHSPESTASIPSIRSATFHSGCKQGGARLSTLSPPRKTHNVSSDESDTVTNSTTNDGRRRFSGRKRAAPDDRYMEPEEPARKIRKIKGGGGGGWNFNKIPIQGVPGSRKWRAEVERRLSSEGGLTAQEEAMNASFGYTLIDTMDEGTEPFGTVAWMCEQQEFRRLQYEAIVMLVTAKRHDKRYGLMGSHFTPVRYWAKRREANRLIQGGLSPWHLEFEHHECSFMGAQIDMPPPIPQWYCDKHKDVILTSLREKAISRVKQLLQSNSDPDHYVLYSYSHPAIPLKDKGFFTHLIHSMAPRYFLSPEACTTLESLEDIGFELNAPANQGTPSKHSPPPETNRQRRKKQITKSTPAPTRRSTRRNPEGDLLELDISSKAQKATLR